MTTTKDLPSSNTTTRTRKKRTPSKTGGPSAKATAAAGKTDYSGVPFGVMDEVALAMAEGDAKYGKFSWRSGPSLKAAEYTSALLRHLFAWVGGEHKDKTSGASHLAHVIAGCMVMLDAQRHKKLKIDK